MYRDVTLAPEDVEWDDPARDLMSTLSNAVWDEGTAWAMIREHGIEVALEAVSRLRRVVANQLRRRAVTDLTDSEWSRRAGAKVIYLRQMRGKLRTEYRREYGNDRYMAWQKAFDRRWPRAEWGNAR